MAKRYDAAPIDVNNASYEVRLNGSTIDVRNIDGIAEGTLFAKSGSVSVTVNGTSHSLDVPANITSIEVAATAIKSILYVLNGAAGHTTEPITGAKNIAGDDAPAGLTFEQLTQVY